MSKSLSIIQKIAKVGKILSKISWIASLVGVIGGAVGLICLQLLPYEFVTTYIMKVGEGTLLRELYAAIIAAVIVCAAQLRMGYCAARYFKNELEAGTPFTFEGAKELKRLGIQVIVLSILASVLAATVYAGMTLGIDTVSEFEFDFNVSLGMGIMFIVTSVICNYGAELLNPYEDENEQR